MNEIAMSIDPKPTLTRNEIVGLIGEAVMDGCEQHPPFPAMPSYVAWIMAREIATRLEQIGIKLP